jgi:hypothetical protein
MSVRYLRGVVSPRCQNAACSTRPPRPSPRSGSFVAYLLSEQASFVSGAIVPVDGGRSARGPDPEER